MKALSLSVPANLLLLGEYAVTEEGGRGLALAVAPRVRARVEPAVHGRRGLLIRGLMRDSRIEVSRSLWPGREGGKEEDETPLLAACLAVVGGFLENRHPYTDSAPGFSIELDSSAFFAPDGSKRGLGSSAAVAVALTAALLRGGGIEGDELQKAIFPLALTAHRRAQGGRGSGYDVAASRFGGLGLFVGGVEPSWQALRSPSLAGFFLLQGLAPISSASSVSSYRVWKEADPAAHASFLLRSRALIENLLEGGLLPPAGPPPGPPLGPPPGPPHGPLEDGSDAPRADPFARALFEALVEGRRLGIELGEAIGVSARLEPPPGLPTASLLKALGAGNELGLLVLPPGVQQARELEPHRFEREGPGRLGVELLPLKAESEGLRWD